MKKIIIAIIFLVVASLIVYFVFPEFSSKISQVVDLIPDEPRVIENEQLVIPQTEKITQTDSVIVQKGTVEIPFAPKTEAEKVVVPKAILTVKGSYNLAKTEAEKWASDAVPVFIKSIGAITLEGKSSQWQLAFSSASAKATADKSKTTQKGYEIIIQGDQIVSQKEIDSTIISGKMPIKWKDSGEVIASLAQHPYFGDATVSSIKFYYNLDNKNWRYAFATSKGTTSALAE